MTIFVKIICYGGVGLKKAAKEDKFVRLREAVRKNMNLVMIILA